MRYGGFFALYGDEIHVSEMSGRLAGGSILIRYDPSDPGVSYLADYNDPRFDGLTATQNPEWLDQSPVFDLQDVIR